jgi:hypothetical protein
MTPEQKQFIDYADAYYTERIKYDITNFRCAVHDVEELERLYTWLAWANANPTEVTAKEVSWVQAKANCLHDVIAKRIPEPLSTTINGYLLLENNSRFQVEQANCVNCNCSLP